MPASRTLFLLPICSLAPMLAAQTITAGAATFSFTVLPTTETPGAADVLNGGGGDILYQHWWWFRVAGDTREYAFKDDGTATRTVNGAGDTMTTTWTNVDNRGVFAATLTQSLQATGAAGALLTETMTITNLSGSQLDIALFGYTDFDVAGSGTDLAKGGLSSQVVIDQTNTLLAGEYRTQGNSGAAVDAFATIRNLLTNTAVDNFTTWSGAFGPGDYTGGYQWSLQIPVTGTATVASQLASLNCRPNSTVYGTGGAGTNGVPTISSDFPVMRASGTNYAIHLRNGRPSALCALMLNLSSTNQTLFGMNILVNPVGVTNLIGTNNAAGEADVGLGLPPSVAAFCGLSIYGQWLVLDPAAASGPAATSAGLQMTLGSW
ncbi:MAG: hypothetical protein KDC98_07445 [Planctomycetes bacterium]|nr:hypothetical protein [Planctomycetota bacterium]